MEIKRHENNPIITPGVYPWRKIMTFNPGVIYENGQFHLLERAGSVLRPMRCEIGLLSSDDGVHFKHVVDHPVFTPEQLGRPGGTVEDPRVVKIDDYYYMTFAHRPFTYSCNPTGYGVPEYETTDDGSDANINNTRAGIAKSRDLIDWEFVDFTTPPDIDDRNNVLFPAKINDHFILLRRPLKIVENKYDSDKAGIWMCKSPDLESWTPPKLVALPEREWESNKIGAGPPPILTDEGWLLIYHAVDAESVYRIGAMLLDKNDPTHVLARTDQPILEPTEYYERFGLVIPNVIFPTGLVLKDDLLYIYYGCTDTCISLATVLLKDLLSLLSQSQIHSICVSPQN